jgi:hypothetical protein
MATAKSQNLPRRDAPEIFITQDARWASRAAARGEIRRLARGLYSTNLDEPVEQLLRRRWYDVAALYFPGAVVGIYKEAPNRAGMTLFVEPELVRGTLREGFTAHQTLPAGLPRAIYAMFLVAEVHPFADGNGRVARILMNSELSAAGLCRVMVPIGKGAQRRSPHMTPLAAPSSGSSNTNP